MGLFEQSLIDWAKSFCSPDAAFVDAGAHTGTYSVSLSPVAKTVYAFEPQRLTFMALCGSIALSGLRNVHCFQYALGDKTQVGKTMLYINTQDGGGSSILPKIDSITEEVDVRTLDSFDLPNISLIKIDVEGNESRVIEGAIKTIQKYQPKILFEDNSRTVNIDNYPALSQLKYRVFPIRGYPNMFLASNI
jgi:FkbM family methyltransferase